MTIRGASRRTIIDRKKAESLVFPIVAVLNGSGLKKKEAISVFSSAYERAMKILPARQLEYIGHPTLYADTVGLWVRDKRFLDRSGRPRALSFQGKNGFSTLVRQIQRGANPKEVLSILIRCGNIRRIRKDKYSLVQPFFRADGPKSMAFEPNAYFLSDASLTLGRLVLGNNSSHALQPFWRKVETSDLSEALARKFSLFARERTLSFLEELYDWLGAHKNRVRTKKARRRVGIGVFSIYSDPEVNES